MPAATIRSWIRAMNAPTAIRHWNLTDRYIETTIRNTIRPSMAFTVMSWPQLELTAWMLILLWGRPRSLATFVLRFSCWVGSMFLVLTTICRVDPEPTCRAGSADGTPPAANAASVCFVVTDVPATWSWNWVPPLNSTPRLNPRITKLNTQIRIRISEARYHRRRVPMKLKRSRHGRGAGTRTSALALL